MTATTLAPTLTTRPDLRSNPPQIRPLAGIGQTLTMTWRTLIQIKNDPGELIGMTLQPVIFTLMFSFVFGGAIGGDVSTYVQFLIPGILVGTMLFTTLAVGQGLNSDMKKGVYDRFRSLPITRWAPLAGRVLADQAKQLWAIVVAVAIGATLGFRPVTGVGGMLAAVGLILLFAAAFSWVAILLGVLCSEPTQVDMFGFTILLPISFASGVYSPPDTMPGWLRWFAEVNPAGMLLQACRGLISGGPVLGPVLGTLAWCAVLVAVFAPLSVRALRRRT